MIQHLKIDSPPVIKSQLLLNLGRVNILTGRNSGGKSTILRTISQKPDLGITYKNSTKVLEIINELFTNYTRPTREELADWTQRIISTLEGKILFSSSQEESLNIIRSAKESSRVRNINVNDQVQQIAYRIPPVAIAINQILLLSPKRRMLYETEAIVTNKLDTEANNVLSRLFYLQNEIPGSEERIRFEKIQAYFRDITGYEFVVRLIQNPLKIQLQLRRIGSSWIFGQNEGLGLAEILSIITYSLDGEHTLLLIEEPENHIHPDLQRKLLLFLNSVEDRQFILSTHSPVFLNPTMVDRIFFCKYIDGEIRIDDNTSRANALSEIGVLAIDNLTSDAIVITEGK